jgi:hypothetical protein
MADDPVDLRSVNWTQGMFLTPDHFLRQERYVDSLVLWLMRFGLDEAGLVGGGPRVESSERGAARFDPIVDVDDSSDTLKVSVTQCRGITRSGVIVDVDPSRPVQASFSKRELDGVLELGIYVVARPHEKEADDTVEDPVNPQMALGRRMRYTVQLDVRADAAPASLLLARLRRSEKGLRFERELGFIPPAVFMCAHSELMHAFRQLNEMVAAIADHYGALHRAIVDYVALARSRAINVEQDLETLAFVSRMVTTLEACAYELLDPLQSPTRFFQQMTRLIRSAALFLSLSPPTREYFRLLGEIGEVEFVSLLEQEGEALGMARGWTVSENLNLEVQKTMRALDRLDRLEQALEGKYLDFRVSPSLESLNFVFDRTSGDAVLYKSVAKPARPQAHGQELTFVFAPLRLEAREYYRLVIVGERQARFMPGDRLTAELRINPGEGYSHAPDYRTTEHEIDGHRNFAIDFKAPEDVVMINDLRVSLRSNQPIRSAILYVRGRLMPGSSPVAPPMITPRGAPREDWSSRIPREDPAAAAPRRRSRLDEAAAPARPEPTDPSPTQGPRRRLS